MMTFNELKEKWDTIPVYANAFLLLDSSHPLEINIGYEELNQKTLLIMNSGELHNLPSSKSIAASNYQFPDGCWVLSFRLIRADNEDVFLRFCWDIIESSRDDNRNTIEFILKRYAKWLRLLEHIHADVMSASRQKGLVGELMYLADLADNCGIEKAVVSWCGPDDTDQDFIYDDTWAEIKAVTAAAETVSISSLEQLEVNFNGTLVIYYIEKTTPDNISGFSLAQKVAEVRNLAARNIIAKDMLELKLFQYGYKDLKEYETQKYRMCSKDAYIVNDDFPRLTNKNVDVAIVRAQYALSLSAIERFKK